MKLNVDFSKLPIEIINMIINYTDVIVFRHGKYINRIKKDDVRYDIIRRRKIPMLLTNNIQKVKFKFVSFFGIKYVIIEQRFMNNRWYLIVKTIINNIDNTLKQTNISRYIYDNFGACNKTILYEM